MNLERLNNRQRSPLNENDTYLDEGTHRGLLTSNKEARSFGDQPVEFTHTALDTEPALKFALEMNEEAESSLSSGIAKPSGTLDSEKSISQKKKTTAKKKKAKTAFSDAASFSSSLSQYPASEGHVLRSSSSSSERRRLEVEAYSAVISAFKEQGELTWKKESLLQELRGLLKISDERHLMELHRLEGGGNFVGYEAYSSGHNAQNLSCKSSGLKSIKEGENSSPESSSSDHESNMSDIGESRPGHSSRSKRMRPSEDRATVASTDSQLHALPYSTDDTEVANVHRILPSLSSGYNNLSPAGAAATASTMTFKLKGVSKEKKKANSTGKKVQAEKLSKIDSKEESILSNENEDFDSLNSSSLATNKHRSLSMNREDVSFADVSSLTDHGLPPDVVSARQTGDLEKLKEALERHKAQVRAQLEALGAQKL